MAVMKKQMVVIADNGVMMNRSFLLLENAFMIVLSEKYAAKK